VKSQLGSLRIRSKMPTDEEEPEEDPFATLERLEKEVETIFQGRQLAEMRTWVVRVTVICGILLTLVILGRPVFWSLNTLYGTQKYTAMPAIFEPPVQAAPYAYEGKAEPEPVDPVQAVEETTEEGRTENEAEEGSERKRFSRRLLDSTKLSTCAWMLTDAVMGETCVQLTAKTPTIESAVEQTFCTLESCPEKGCDHFHGLREEEFPHQGAVNVKEFHCHKRVNEDKLKNHVGDLKLIRVHRHGVGSRPAGEHKQGVGSVPDVGRSITIKPGVELPSGVDSIVNG